MAAAELWSHPRSRLLARECLLHPFVRQLGDSSLPTATFRSYVAQDVFFLRAFQQAYNAASVVSRKAGLENQASRFSKLRDGVDEELVMHAKAAARMELDLAVLEPLAATQRYVGFLDQQALRASDADVWLSLSRLCAAMVPCMRLYFFLGTVLAQAATLEEEMYRNWVTEYSSQGFTDLVSEIENLLDTSFAAASGGPEVMEELTALFLEAMECELAFFSQVAQDGPGGLEPKSLLKLARLKPPTVLIIAGSDSGGGAGIQADIKSCTAHGVFSMTAITALTAQNTHGVQGVFPVPPEFVLSQVRSVMDDLGADVVKSGMLATQAVVEAVVSCLQGRAVQLVVDPVMISTSGHRLLDQAAVQTVRERLLPLATIVTPNLHEAGLLLGRDISTVQEMEVAAREISAMGPRWTLVKGGHLSAAECKECTDVLCEGATGNCERFSSPMVSTSHTHGTGCSLASAIAACLARGSTIPEAVRSGKEFVAGAIAASAHLNLGHGPQGPMNHSWRSFDW